MAAYWEINEEVALSGQDDMLYTGLLQIQSSPQLLMGPAHCLFISAQISTENRLLTMGFCSRQANLDRASQTGNLLLG